MSDAGLRTPRQQPGGRKFLGVHFRCCNLYQRIYCNVNGTAYEGRCPRCGKTVRIPIGEGGSTGRFFEAH